MDDLLNQEKLIVTPLRVWRALFFGKFGDSGAPSEHVVLSCLLGEKHYVKPIYYSLGKTIAELDSDEQYFHVELIEPQKHAELWLIEDWRESSTRREKLKLELAISRATRNVLEEIFSKIHPVILQKFGGQKTLAEKLAWKLANNYKNDTYPNVLEELGIKTIMDHYRKENTL
jgi:hypothetical protein